MSEISDVSEADVEATRQAVADRLADLGTRISAAAEANAEKAPTVAADPGQPAITPLEQVRQIGARLGKRIRQVR